MFLIIEISNDNPSDSDSMFGNSCNIYSMRKDKENQSA